MKRLFFYFSLTLVAISIAASDDLNSDSTRQVIDLTQISQPKPSVMVDAPIAMYNTATGTLTITLDATYYSDYVITIEGDYASMDYYVTSPVVVFPASSLSEVSYIYIDSDDCGTYIHQPVALLEPMNPGNATMFSKYYEFLANGG